MPTVVQRPVLSTISRISRTLPGNLGSHLYAFATGVKWKAIDIKPKQVLIGDCSAMITPHIGEFDFAASFLKKLNYEVGLVDWVNRNAANYSVIIEMGANVGMFTVLLGHVCKHSKTRIVSLEPSRAAFARLYANLRQNQVNNVTILNAAAGERTEMREFFEPEGHLTNGSFVANFASIFSDVIDKNYVISLGPEFLEPLVPKNGKILIKMDVEGFEPQLLKMLGDFIRKHRPDLILEVLSETEADLRDVLNTLGFQHSHLICDHGIESHPQLFASPASRDWLLTY